MSGNVLYRIYKYMCIFIYINSYIPVEYKNLEGLYRVRGLFIAFHLEADNTYLKSRGRGLKKKKKRGLHEIPFQQSVG